MCRQLKGATGNGEARRKAAREKGKKIEYNEYNKPELKVKSGKAMSIGTEAAGEGRKLDTARIHDHESTIVL